jgi:hypothetical protein
LTVTSNTINALRILSSGNGRVATLRTGSTTRLA